MKLIGKVAKIVEFLIQIEILRPPPKYPFSKIEPQGFNPAGKTGIDKFMDSFQ